MQINPRHLEKIPQVHSHPWPHFVIDEFLPSKEFTRLQKRILERPHEYLMREDDPEQLQFTTLPDLRFFKFLLSPEVQSFFEELINSRLELYRPGAIQLRRMTPESPAFPPHYDLIDQRSMIMLYYLAPGWSPEKGGELQLLKSEDTDPKSNDAVRLGPLENRMVLFLSDSENWHAVSSVSNWTRYVVMAEWILV